MLSKRKIKTFSQISLEITNICNFQCDFCPSKTLQRKRISMPFETVKKIVDEIVSLNLLGKGGYISPFILGEPLAHPEADKILRYMKDRNIKVVLNTNASFLTPDRIEFLYSIGINKLLITVSKDNDAFLLRSTAISYQEYLNKVVEAIKRHLAGAPLTEIEILILLHKQDLESYPLNIQSLNSILAQLDIDSGDFYKDIMTGISWRLYRRMQYPIIKKELLPGIHITFAGFHNWGNSVNCDPNHVKRAFIGSCNALRNEGQIAILADGTYSLCCLDYEGMTRLPYKYDGCSFTELFNNQIVRDIAFKFETCRLPYDFCRYCKGGDTTIKWLFNQLFSSIYYNIPNHKMVRRLITVKK